MTLSILNIRPAKSEEWDVAWRNCDYSTYFHSREWSEIWNIYTRGGIHSKPILVTFSDGLSAILPISLQKSYGGLIMNHLLSPAETFGGWISQDEINIDHAYLLTNLLTMEMGNIFWRLNPFDPLVLKLGISETKKDETQALNLVKGFSGVYKKWTKGHSSAVTKAQREGVQIKLGSSEADWRNYYDLYQDSIRRWGSASSGLYQWEIFNEMFNRTSSDIKLWLATYQEQAIAGAICFYSKKHVVYWHGAALEKYFNLRPVNYLIYSAIKHACDHRYLWFDFNPSGGHAGVESFKKSFGTESLPCPVFIRQSRLLGTARKIKNSIKILMD